MAKPIIELRTSGKVFTPRFQIRTSITASDGAGQNDYMVLFGSSGTNTFELPLASDNPGRIVGFRRIWDGINNNGSVTGTRLGADLIDGLTTFPVAQSLEMFLFQSDGVSAWTSFAALRNPQSIILTTAAAAYTVLDTDGTILANSSGNNITINLPTAGSNRGRIITVKKIDAANTVTIDPSGAETIDGAATFEIMNLNNSITFQSNGTGWFII